MRERRAADGPVFAVGVVIPAIGPGGTPAIALLAASSMAIAGGISPLLMAIMVGNGAWRA
jgi:hypothetical protein